MYHDQFLIPPGKKVKLKNHPADFSEPFKSKADAAEKLQADVARLAEMQSKLYAQNTYALLIILQGIDAAGKDSTIKHVMSGASPLGCSVTDFKVPSAEELDHDYLWRYTRAMPERGGIGIFNRSYYEEVLVVRVHPELLAKQHIPHPDKLSKLWPVRYREMNELESYLKHNGVEILKFFLHVSKEEQRQRFLARLESPDKNWKFSENDVRERAFWDDYVEAFEDMLSNTSTEQAPWYVIPADHKWFAHVSVADIVVQRLIALKLDWPRLDDAQKTSLEAAKLLLLNEK